MRIKFHYLPRDRMQYTVYTYRLVLDRLTINLQTDSAIL